MDESEGIHGPVSEQVIASLFEKHHGPNVYNMREGRIPSWYTDNMQYFYEIYKGKILSTLGYIDKQTYYILGGAFVYGKWKKDSGYFGKPLNKLMGLRETKLKRDLPKIAGFKYTGPVTPDRNQETYVEMMSQYYDIDPVDTKGIPEDMVDNFSNRYPNAWGVRINGDSDSLERMAKGLSDWFSSSWWDVVKVQVLDTSTGIQSINEPMIEDKDCYNKLMQKMESWLFNPKLVSLEITETYLDNVVEFSHPSRAKPGDVKQRNSEHRKRGRIIEDYSSNEMKYPFKPRDVELEFYGVIFEQNWDTREYEQISEEDACTILEIFDLLKSANNSTEGTLNGLKYNYYHYSRAPVRTKKGIEESRELVIERELGTKYKRSQPLLDLDTRLIFNYGVIINLGEVIRSLDFLKW